MLVRSSVAVRPLALLVVAALVVPGWVPPAAAEQVPGDSAPLLTLEEALATARDLAAQGQHPEAGAFLDALPTSLAPLPEHLRLDPSSLSGALRVPGGKLQGPVAVDAPWVVEGDLALDGASVSFGPSGALYVEGDLHATGATFLGHNRNAQLPQFAREPPRAFADADPRAAASEAMARALPQNDNFVLARGAVDVRGSAFDGAELAVPAGPAMAKVQDSAFQHGMYGVVANRQLLVVERSSFVDLGAGVAMYPGDGPLPVGGDAVVHDAYPEIANNMFEMDLYGIFWSYGAGHLHHNVGRANFQAVACWSPGYEDGNGDVHQPLFDFNNLYTNYGDAISDFRGVVVNTPLGPIGFPDSQCDHDNVYLGPGGDKQDSYFISTKDTLTNIRATPNTNSAPALPLPITEVVTAVTWTGPVSPAGPVIVNDPGALTLDHASYDSPYFLGAKVNGKVVLQDSSVGPDAWVFFRNADDEATRTQFGAPLYGQPFGGQSLVVYRANSTIEDSTLLGYTGLYLLSGYLTDDAQWLPTVDGSTFLGYEDIIVVANVKATITASTLKGYLGILNDVLPTIVLKDSVINAAIGYEGIIATLTSTGNRYEHGSIGVISELDTDAFTNDLFGDQYYGIFPILDVSVAVTLTNFTLNQYGIVPFLTAVTVSTSNFVDNVPLAMEAIPLDIGAGVDIPTGITCAQCWAPPDESWFGNVSYTAAALPNAVADPSWHGHERIAFPGQTLDVSGPLDQGPAVARSGGTLRVADASLQLTQRWPVLAKGGGMNNATPGRLVMDNASVSWSYDVSAYQDFDFAYWSSMLLNSTQSSIRMSTFEGFYDAPFQAIWNGGGTFECVDWQSYYAPLVTFQAGQDAFQVGADRLTLRRVLVQNGSGVNWFQNYLPDAADPDARVTIEDSGIRGAYYHGPMLYRGANGDAQVHRTNFLGSWMPAFYDFVYDFENDVRAFDASDNWWDSASGPWSGGGYYYSYAYGASGYVSPVVTPYASEPFAPEPCMAWDVLSAPPIDDAPVRFHDRSFDPSGLAADHVWDWGDGSSTTTAGDAFVEHQYARYGTYTIRLTVRSDSGGEASLAKSVRVLARPQPSFSLSPASPVETDTLTFTDTSTDPDGRVVARSWDLGDGTTSTASTVNHRYADGGTYPITLTARDDDGLTRALTSSATVRHLPPRPDFSARADRLDVQFTDRSTHPNPADAPPRGWSYLWDFGDGAGSTERSPFHGFAAEDVFHVALQVTDDDGLTASFARDIDLRNKPPVPDFDFSPSVPVAGGDTFFEDQSTDEDDSVEAWFWDFGDGATSREQNPSHRFAAGGDYTVTLEATDDRGASNSTSQSVHVCETGVFVDLDVPRVHAEVCRAVTLQDTLRTVEGIVDGAPAVVDGLVQQVMGLLPEAPL
jgi:PKD repeat protein